jgi:hypothetical protein
MQIVLRAREGGNVDLNIGTNPAETVVLAKLLDNYFSGLNMRRALNDADSDDTDVIQAVSGAIGEVMSDMDELEAR